ncbi:nuclear pore complex protein Nup214 [Hetaerina americana]|uniref:nuclear pore complex protein Nup214 n=1 Tax=Hetaerina americana TaxID=62018 RepID=UPI003A7F5536
MTNPPLPRDVQDFQFKIASRLKVYEKSEDLSSSPVNLLAVSSKHGLVFVGAPTNLQIFQTSLLLENHGGKGVGVDVDTFPRYCINLSSRPSHVAINCDDALVAVVLTPGDASQFATALVYSISSLVLKNLTPAWEIRLSAVPGVAVQDIAWNPRLPQLICVCLCDGSVTVNELKGSSQNVESISIPAATGAKCISWSPKGKQLVIGTAHGPFIQFKPDLKQVKVIPAPQPAGLAPISLLWLSSFQFAAVYGNPSDNGSGTSRPGLYIVNTPKGESESYLNYDDICYSSGELRPPQYYLSHIPKWNVLLMSSANSMEVGVLASPLLDGVGADPLVWEQWTLEDASRAELPLSPLREEMYAVGMALDTSSTTPLPWGENQSIPPAPLLLILSHHGLLCSFSIINLRPGAAQDLCSPPQGIPGIGEVLTLCGPAPAAPPPSFGVPPQSQAVAAFPPASSAFLQGQASPFPLATTAPSFAPLPSAAPSSLFGSQTAKTDVGKGWLSGSPASNSFGFGSLGAPAVPSKDVPLSSSAQSFSFTASLATVFPTTTLTALAQTPQVTSTAPIASQQQVPSFTFPAASTQQPVHPMPSTQHQEPMQGLFGSTLSSVAPSKFAPDRNKPMTAPSGDSFAVGKIKFGDSPAMPEGGGNNNSAETGKEDFQKSLQPPEVLTEVTKSVPEVHHGVQTAAQQPSATPAPPPRPAVSDAAIFNAIAQETALFEKELHQLKMRHQKFNIGIGTSEEKKSLRVKVGAMEDFLSELSEVTQVHTTTEIHALRTLLMEAFAWVEEARSRNLYSKNPRYLHLAMVQELDPVIRKHVMAIRNRVHYLDTQLQQMDSSLDNQWAMLQDACHKKKRKQQQKWGSMASMQLDKREIHMPSLEFVYQTILSQQQILEKHRARLDELELKVRNRVNWELNGSLFASLIGYQTQSKGRSSNNREQAGKGDQDLSSMAESLLALHVGDSKFEGQISEQLGSKNPLVPNKMSSRHMSQLCSLLAHKPMTRVIPSPRGISSLNVLPMPSMLADSNTPTPKEDASATHRVDNLNASASEQTPKATSTPVKKEVTPVAAVGLPNVLAGATTVTGPPALAFSFGSPPAAVGSKPAFEESAGSLLDSKQSRSVAPRSEPMESPLSAAIGFTRAMTTTSVKSSTVPTKAVFARGFSGATTPVLSSSSSTSTFGTTKSAPLQQVPQTSSIFSGTPSSVVSPSPLESSSWAFSTSGSFSIGTSSKAGGISSGKPVVPPSPLTLAPVTTPPPTTTPSSFSLNFSAVSKPSFSLTSKPAPQPSFTLPLPPVFGTQGGSSTTSSSKEEQPLFVFGGSALGSAISAHPPVAVAGENAASAENTEKENILNLEKNKTDKDSGASIPEFQENKEKTKPEKLPTNFSFVSAFSQAAVPSGKTTLTDTEPASRATVSAPTPDLVQSSIYEDVTPENKVQSSAVKEKPEEKPAASRSLFTDFSFKLSEGECEAFGSKPLVFGASSIPSAASPPPASTPAVAPIFGTPTSTAQSPQPSAPTEPTPASSLPIVSQPESTTAIGTSNPLSSLGTIVANLGSGTGSTFGKLVPEAAKPAETSSFTTFTFALPPKDDVAKTLPSETAVDSPLGPDGQKAAPLKSMPSVSSPGPTLPGAPAVTTSSTASDFGQGLANILGQSLPVGSPSQQQQPAQNPFATGGSGGGVFGGSDGSSPSNALLFGKPAEGSSPARLFGQPLKQDAAATPSFFGSSPSATPPVKSGQAAFVPALMFGQPRSSTSSVFGSSSGFGSKPLFGQSLSGGSTSFSQGGSVFGQSGASSPSVFGSPPATSGGNLFQTTATSSAGTFGTSGGSLFGSVAQAGFGSPTSSFQAKPGGFGGSPVFGAMASGGSSPSFGGAATFGSPPAFGSHVFGASVSNTGTSNVFGSGGASSPSTFENLATAPGLTFGNLAQGGGTSPFGASQSPPAPTSTFGSGGNTSSAAGSSTFGGSSFTSWR